MPFEALQEVIGKKRRLEILNLLAEEGTLNYSDIENRVETSSDVVSESLDTLADYGLVERIEKSSRDVRYAITTDGDEFLSELEALEDRLPDYS
jgi:DNA-binding HxlR family transcriptional regulator